MYIILRYYYCKTSSIVNYNIYILSTNRSLDYIILQVDHHIILGDEARIFYLIEIFAGW
jgi:hypothetical protein